MTGHLKFALSLTLALMMVLAAASLGLAADVVIEEGESIQDAINDAESGDTIEVEAGRYEEDLKINTEDLSLEADGEVILEGSICIEADGASVYGFTVDADGDDFGILIDAADVSVVDNAVRGAAVGLEVKSSKDAVVEDNIFEENDIQVDDWSEELELEVDQVLADNSFDRAVVVRGSGIVVPRIYSRIQDAVDNALSEKTVNVYPGVYRESILLQEDKLTVKAVRDNQVNEAAIVEAVDDNAFTIEADDVAVEGFAITGGENGIVASGEGNIIFRNEIVDNSRRGIHLLSDAESTFIEENVIYGNGRPWWFSGGILIDEGSTRNVVWRNCIADNDRYNLRNRDEDPVLAIENWWGDEQGPGDSVRGDVDYDSWIAQLNYTGAHELDGEGKLEAEVIGSNGDGVGGVEVEFYIAGKLAGISLTDDEGTAEVDIDAGEWPPGEQRVTVRALGCMEDTETVFFDYDGHGLEVLVEGEIEDDIEALEDAQVAVKSEDYDLIWDGKTDEEGTVEFDGLLSGNYEVTVRADGYYRDTIEVRIDDEDESVAVLLGARDYRTVEGDIIATARPNTINVRSRGHFVVMIQTQDHRRFHRAPEVLLENGNGEIKAVRVQDATFRLICHFDRTELIELLDGEAGEYELPVLVGDGDEGYLEGNVTVNLVLPGQPSGRAAADDSDGWVPPGLR